MPMARTMLVVIEDALKELCVMRKLLICALLVLPMAAFAGNKPDHSKPGHLNTGGKMARSISTMADDTPGDGSGLPGDGEVPVVIDHDIIGGRLMGHPIEITADEGTGDGGMLVSIREIQHGEFTGNGGDSSYDDGERLDLPTDGTCEGDSCNAVDPLPEE